MKMTELKDLERFVKRVAEMRAQGQTTRFIASVLGVPTSTLALRERRYRELQITPGVKPKDAS